MHMRATSPEELWLAACDLSRTPYFTGIGVCLIDRCLIPVTKNLRQMNPEIVCGSLGVCGRVNKCNLSFGKKYLATCPAPHYVVDLPVQLTNALGRHAEKVTC